MHGAMVCIAARLRQVPTPEPTPQVTPAMTKRLPTHQLAYEQLRDMVLFGELPPGAAVTIEGLTARLGLGMTPVREAIRRLIAEGALALQGNRRVSVPRPGGGAIRDLGFARRAIEPHLAARAAEAEGRAGLLSDLHAIDTDLDDALARGDIRAYLRENHRFHFRLYRAAGSDVLVDLVQSLWLRFGPSLRVVCAASGDAVAPDNHKIALDALSRGDRASLEAAICADIMQGEAMILSGLQSGLLSSGSS